MSKKVKVTSNDEGAIIIVSENNPDYGHIRVTQERIIFDINGFAKPRVISAFVHGTLDDLKSIGWSAGQEVEGKIIERESLKPFNPKQPERDYKVAGKTGVICNVDGQPIYRKTLYTTNINALDERIAHTNTNEIKLAFDALKEQEALKPSQEFAL